MTDADFEMDQETRHELLDGTIVQQSVPLIASGIAMRPMSAASRAMLRHIENGFMSGTASANPELSCLTYAWIHSQPIDVVVTAVYGSRNAFLATVMQWGEALGSDDVDQLTDMVLDHMGAKANASTKLAKSRGGIHGPKHSGQRR